MAKRKRNESAKDEPSLEQPLKAAKSTAEANVVASAASEQPAITVQIVTGSYERVLHGFTATIPLLSTEAETAKSAVQFFDTFLFQAHASAVRCLALSPLSRSESSEPQKVILASGGTDERVNLYTLAASPAAANDNFPAVPTLGGNKILENPKNRELGSLLHHSSSISALHFPSHSKLLVAAEDNAISITRTRDWSVISTIKAPRPKVQGRPSGDTAPPGASPAGVNDFAVHPSMKLMLSVGRGERCMRLWNLVTGKKAGVLNFSKEILQGAKESKYSTGEGRKIEWSTDGEEFAVAFDRGVVVFGTDSMPICRALPNPPSKVHQIKYISSNRGEDEKADLLAMSTEDGRIIFFTTRDVQKADAEEECTIPYAQAVAQLGGRSTGVQGRVKDFEILSLQDQPQADAGDLVVVTAGSDGAVRVWLLKGSELTTDNLAGSKATSTSEKDAGVRQVGTLLNTYETGNRITCLRAFVMLQPDPSSAHLDSDEEEEPLEADDLDESTSEDSDDE